jgi:hypothetical protein
MIMVWDLAQGMVTTIQGVFTQFQIEASRQEFQTDVEIFRSASQFALQGKQQEFQKDVEILRTASQFALQGKQQEFQTDVEIFRSASQFALQGKQQEFQAALEGVRQKHSKEMEAYRQYCENARLQKRQDFEREQLTRRLQHEQRLEEYRRETQLILSRLQLLMGIELADDKQIRDTFPLKTPARVILEAYKGYQESYRNIPLLVIISPPALEFEKFPNAAQGFSKIEVSLTDKVQEFGKYYPLTSQERPVRYQGADWESKSSHGKSAVDILHHVLNSIPTVVLESKVDGDLLRIYLAGWDMLEKVPHYEKVLTIPWKDVLYPIARKYAQEWREHRMKLSEKGRSLEDIKRRGGDDELNLLILEEEEEDREFGRSGQHDYKYNVREDKYIRELAQFLGICHCILVGLMADRYHFSHGDVRPKLPELLPGLLEKVPSDGLKEMLVGEIVSSYQNLYQLTGVDRPHLIPYLFLDLALSLSYLPDKSWARKQIEYSLLSWLKLRNLVDSFAEQKADLLDLLLEAFTSALIMADVEYTEKLNGCLAAIGESHHQETIQNAIQGEQNAEYQRQLEAERLRQEEEEAERKCKLENVSLVHTPDELQEWVKCLAISPDGQTLVGGSNNKTIKIWDLSTGQELRTITGHSDNVKCLAISPDGQTLVSGSSDKRTKIWELSTGLALRTLTGHSGSVVSLTISPDGQTLVSGSEDCTIKIWELSTGRELLTLTGNYNPVVSLTISPDGQTLVSAGFNKWSLSSDRDQKIINIWELSTGKLLRTLTGHSEKERSSWREPNRHLAISPDGQTLVSCDDGEIKIWRVE